jgi:hypothetical protein
MKIIDDRSSEKHENKHILSHSGRSFMFISKRVLIIIGIVVVVVMLGAGIGLAYAFSALSQQTSTNASLSATATAAAVPSPRAGAQNGQRRITGIIQSLNSSSFVLSVNQGKRKITVDITAQTKFGRAGKSASLSDLQVGEAVVVVGTLDTSTLTMQATRVTISPRSGTPAPVPTATP